MRSSRRTLVAVLAGLLLVPQLAAADEVEEQLRQMQERMSALEDQLTATNDQLEQANKRVSQQEDLIERAGIEDERGSASGLSAFIEQTEFNLSIATSYFYNVNNPDSNATAGANNGNINANPFHPNSNSFQVDEVWFSMMKAATVESRAGFGIDIVFGQTADQLNAFNASGFGSGSGQSDQTSLYQGYITYLAPIMDGLEFKAGRFETITGAEVARSTQNFNVTRGLLYSTLQPINHLGGMVSAQYDNGFQWALGGVNDSGYANVGAFPSLNNDSDNDKVLLARVGYSNDTMSALVNVVYGGDEPYGTGAGKNSDTTGLLDVVVNWDPTDDFSAWLNFDYLWIEGEAVGPGASDGSPYALGVAAAGRMALTDRMGFSLRGEYIHGEDGVLLGVAGVGGTGDEELFSVTGTVDYALTDQLTFKTEARWERGAKDNGSNDFYFDNNPGDTSSDQIILGAQLVYDF